MHYFLTNAVKKHEAVNEEYCNTRWLLASVVTWPEVQRLDEEAHVPCLLKSHPGCIKRQFTCKYMNKVCKLCNVELKKQLHLLMLPAINALNFRFWTWSFLGPSVVRKKLQMIDWTLIWILGKVAWGAQDGCGWKASFRIPIEEGLP